MAETCGRGGQGSNQEAAGAGSHQAARQYEERGRRCPETQVGHGFSLVGGQLGGVGLLFSGGVILVMSS